MKKILIALSKVILVIVFGLFIFLQVQQPKRSEANFEDVNNVVLKEVAEYGLELQDNLVIKTTFSIDPNSVTNIAYYKSTDAMDVREVLIVEFDNEEMAPIIEKAAQNRIDAQINAFDGYGPEQVKLLKGANVYSQVNYAIYVTCENSDSVLEAFKEAL